jgi:hypothetical protein
MATKDERISYLEKKTQELEKQLEVMAKDI